MIIILIHFPFTRNCGLAFPVPVDHEPDMHIVIEKMGPRIVSSTFYLDGSNSSSLIFWSSKLGSIFGRKWSGIWSGNSNGSWTVKHSSHYSTAK